MSYYKVLTEEQVKYYKSLSESELGILNYVHTIHNLNNLIFDEEFYVVNGNWDGVLRNTDKGITLFMKEVNSKEYTKELLVALNEIIYLEVRYYKDKYYYEDVSKILTNKTTKLYNADNNCDHEIIGGDNYSGIKCRKCNGWYCA